MRVFLAIMIAGVIVSIGGSLFGHDHDGGMDHDHDHDHDRKDGRNAAPEAPPAQYPSASSGHSD